MPDKTPLTDPILNSPWDEPTRHWQLDPKTNLATDELVDGRRSSTGRNSMPRARKHDVQAPLWDSVGQPMERVNRLRNIVGEWRSSGYPGANSRTRQLLEYWDSDQPAMRPFFCQREALETATWLGEAGQVAQRSTWSGIAGELEGTNLDWNDRLDRIALKMATGSGKTVVMAMLMIWHAVNRSMPRDFLIVAPNLTVKDRLAELRSDHPEYLLPQLTPIQFQPDLNRLRVTILNFQAFQKRDKLQVNGTGDKASGAVRKLLRKDADPRWEETEDEMLHRLLTNHRSGEPIVVINDEAHHCYRMESYGSAKASKDEKDEEGKAALWFSALKALQAQKRLAQVFDLSATPMYLRRPAELQSEHFPWIVSDYPLSDAIEAGLTKIPRVPVDDDSAQDNPVYRNLYEQTKPKTLDGANMQQTVRDALETMHKHYQESVAPEYGKHNVIPVMIAVANNIPNATSLFRWIAGYKDDKGRFQRGQLDEFSNVKPDGSGYIDQPRTLLVHSKLGDGDDSNSALKTIAKQQGELFAPQGSTAKERVQAIRDIFNTVGRKGEPGEHIRCVISVGMLTEGWDAKTVTHIFGFRAFSSQLLCEQVTGRALRRTSFEPDPETGEPRPEYANVFGVPYEFMRGVEMPPTPAPPKEPYVVEPVKGREHLEIEFPNLCGYAWSVPEPTVALDEDKVTPYDVTNPNLPTKTTVAGAVGVTDTQSPAFNLSRQSIIWRTAANAVQQFETDEKRRRALFTSMLNATEAWLQHHKIEWPDEQIEWLAKSPHDEDVPYAIALAVTRSDSSSARILPVYADQRDPMQPRVRSTNIKPFKTTLEPVWKTKRSQLNRAPCHSKTLEYAVAQELDAHWMIEAWARNFRLGWTIPWRDQERDVWANYEPDFIARVVTGDDEPPLHLIIECKGKLFDDASANAKRIAAESQWIPAVEASGDCGRWRYVYLTEDSHITAAISAAIAGASHG